MTVFPQGFGREAYGDPWGAGGAIFVSRASAVGGQTVRVAFSSEPSHFTPGGVEDARNPSNYTLSVVAGEGTQPRALGVGPAFSGPTLGVRAGEWGVDVSVDHPLSFKLRYRVTVQRVTARGGSGLGFPYAAEFQGTTAPVDMRPPSRRQDLVDFANRLFDSGYSFDGSGDIGVQGGLESYRKRVIRRCMTPKGSYAWDRSYGTLLRLKRPISIAELIPLQTDLRQQIKLEPETEDASVVASLVPLPGVLTLNIVARARAGVLPIGLAQATDGTITLV